MCIYYVRLLQSLQSKCRKLLESTFTTTSCVKPLEESPYKAKTKELCESLYLLSAPKTLTLT